MQILKMHLSHYSCPGYHTNCFSPTFTLWSL